MKCPSCGKENSAGSKFCKHCGTSLDQKFKTCKNGHNYDSSLGECPYCPKSEVATVIKTATQSQKTVIDKQANIKTSPDITKTRAEAAKTVVASTPEQKTVIQDESPIEKTVQKTTLGKKLAGWIVSFDLDPSGTDFKIFEGRNKLGKSNACNIVVNDASISDEHALLFYGDNKIILQDELSTYGTFVNDKRINERAQLKDGDKIKFGNISFTIKII
ncbi:FHA domain-containing protein [bacterium BMS3Abin03]|jgi:hypothetical protein|nr:FHA domain-containing protein [bacterium BMS3Abin03]